MKPASVPAQEDLVNAIRATGSITKAAQHLGLVDRTLFRQLKRNPELHAAARRAVAEVVAARPLPEHGTTTRYCRPYRCRCDECREANNYASAQRRKRLKGDPWTG